MNNSSRNDLRKVFLTSNEQDFRDYITNLLRNPGAYVSKTDTTLKNYIIDVSVHTLRFNIGQRKNQVAERRAWITFCLAVLEPLSNGRPSCNRHTKVLNAMHDPQKGQLLYELLESESKRVKQIIENFFSLKPNHNEDHNEEIKLSNWQKAEISELQDFEIKEQSFSRWLNKFQNKLINFLVSDLLHQQLPIAGNSNEQILDTKPAKRVWWPHQKIQLTLEHIATDEGIEDLWIRDKAHQYRNEFNLRLRVLKFLWTLTLRTGIVFLSSLLLWLSYLYFGAAAPLGSLPLTQGICRWFGILMLITTFCLFFWFIYTVSWGRLKVEDLRSSLH